MDCPAGGRVTAFLLSSFWPGDYKIPFKAKSGPNNWEMGQKTHQAAGTQRWVDSGFNRDPGRSAGRGGPLLV